MAEHNLTITKTPRLTVGKSDVIFEVRRGSYKFGRLKISRGNVVWMPRDFTYGYALDWDELEELARQHGIRRRYKF